MKYILSPNIRLRYNIDKSFLINIVNNSVLCISTDAMNLLVEILNNELTDSKLNNLDTNFKKFILQLYDKGIIVKE